MTKSLQTGLTVEEVEGLRDRRFMLVVASMENRVKKRTTHGTVHQSITVTDIAKILGISRSYVSRIEKHAITKLGKTLSGDTPPK